MIKYSFILLLFSLILIADESAILNDNTVIISVDDFSIINQLPKDSTNKKELTFIIRNRSKSQYLFSLKKNNQNLNYISVPSMDDYTKTLSMDQNDIFSLRPLSPPSEDIILSGKINSKL